MILRENIHWVGYVDWGVRDFHSYDTPHGTTYNAYLVRDEKTALIDTVKAPYADRLLQGVAAICDPAQVDYVVCNHAEPDHAGALPRVLAACPNATLLCNKKCAATLGQYHDTSGWKIQLVATGSATPLGKRTLRFMDTPMVHWPESMFTYIPEEKLLFSMDVFGQHYAGSQRCDDEAPLSAVMDEAKTYYANIVMPYGKAVAACLDQAAALEITTIAPSHGVIWRSHAALIVQAYRDWSAGRTQPKVLVIYDTMWESTAAMAEAILTGASLPGVETALIDVRRWGLTRIASEVLDAAALAIGSATVNREMMPQLAAVLCHLQGLRPTGKVAVAFGSYGWGRGGPEAIQQWLQSMPWEISREPLRAQYRPTREVLDECRAAGKALAEKALALGSRQWAVGGGRKGDCTSQPGCCTLPTFSRRRYGGVALFGRRRHGGVPLFSRRRHGGVPLFSRRVLAAKSCRGRPPCHADKGTQIMRTLLRALAAVAVGLALLPLAWADGKAIGPAEYRGVPYQGSVEERAQEAIIIFHGSDTPGEAREDLILRISVQGEVADFAWVVPFPNEPEVKKEDAQLFAELYAYVEARMVRPARGGDKSKGDKDAAAERPAEPPVTVLSRQIVGSFDVAVVRENQPGALNEWLKQEGYQTLEGAEDVLKFYREKKYVYACIKVSDAQLSKQEVVQLHPLRFSFQTGGRDGIFFPMKMTGLQEKPFDVNLYIFYHAWINDQVSKFGYEHRGFRLKYRDWDSPQCEPNAGKTYSNPQRDVFLRGYAHLIPTVTALMQKLHPGERYYLTNIQAFGLRPEAVREWADDLWLFPYYIHEEFVPFDARPGGPAVAAWPGALADDEEGADEGDAGLSSGHWLLPLGAGIGLLAVVALGLAVALRKKSHT